MAVFSDIHGNCVAFDSVLADIKKQSVDGMVCLGDAIQGGAQPAETVSRLREYRVPTVMGNADSWLVTGEYPHAKEPNSDALMEVRAWSLSRLKKRDIDFIRRFRRTIRISLGERDLLCFHGSPSSFNDQIWPTTKEEEFAKMVGGRGNAILCGGHTHLQQLRRFKDSFFFNPGSVGFTSDHSQTAEKLRADDWAEYAVVSSEGKAVGLEFRRVPFDAREWIRLTTVSGRPHADAVASEYSGV
jgi:putative phosphoesterase